jgi:hypothetical protein
MQVLFASGISAMYVCSFYKILHIILRDSNGCMYSLASSRCSEPLK